MYTASQPSSSKHDTRSGQSGSDFARQQLQNIAASVDRLSIHNGEALGFYHALAREALTADELAQQTGTHEAYARYWLQQQVDICFVECLTSGEPHRYRLLPILKFRMFDADRPLVSYRCLW